MKKKKNSLNPLIIFLATIIIVLSIIYGIFINPIKQDNDYIKKHSKFDVHFENPQAILVPEEKMLDGLDFNESSTTLSFSAFLKLNDVYDYTLDVVNNSDTSVNLNQLSMTKANETNGSAENITYTLTWDNGEEIKENDIIEKNSRRKITIHIQDDNEEYIDIYQKYSFTLNMNFIKTK